MNKPQPTRLSILLTVTIIHMALLVWASQQAPVTPPETQTRTSLVGQLMAPATPSSSPSPPLAKAHKVQQPEPVAAPATQTKPLKEASPEPEHTAQSTTEASTEAPVETPRAPDTKPSMPTQNNNVDTTTPPRSDAQHLQNPKPTYPALSKRLGEQGHVLLNVHILANGSVNQINIRTSSGHPRLDEAALTAVKQWTYLPAKRGDQAIDYWYIQPISFVLN